MSISNAVVPTAFRQLTRHTLIPSSPASGVRQSRYFSVSAQLFARKGRDLNLGSVKSSRNSDGFDDPSAETSFSSSPSSSSSRTSPRTNMNNTTTNTTTNKINNTNASASAQTRSPSAAAYVSTPSSPDDTYAAGSHSAQVLGAAVPSFRHFPYQATAILHLYRDFLKHIYTCHPPAARPELLLRLRNEFHSRRHLKHPKMVQGALRRGRGLLAVQQQIHDDRHARRQILQQQQQQQQGGGRPHTRGGGGGGGGYHSRAQQQHHQHRTHHTAGAGGVNGSVPPPPSVTAAGPEAAWAALQAAAGDVVPGLGGVVEGSAPLTRGGYLAGAGMGHVPTRRT